MTFCPLKVKLVIEFLRVLNLRETSDLDLVEFLNLWVDLSTAVLDPVISI